jgi:hypothetical protein
VECFITDTQEDNGGGCDIVPKHRWWVTKGNDDSKKKVHDARAFVDRLGSSARLRRSSTKPAQQQSALQNLKKNHPRLWFETWLDLNLVASVGGRDPCMPGAPNDKGQIVENKNAPRNACRLASLARSRASASKPTNNSLGPSSDSRNDASSLPNQSPAPEENVSTSKIVPL